MYPLSAPAYGNLLDDSSTRYFNLGQFDVLGQPCVCVCVCVVCACQQRRKGVAFLCIVGWYRRETCMLGSGSPWEWCQGGKWKESQPGSLKTGPNTHV